MNKIKAFLARKDIVFSARRYGIDALGAMAQGLFCSLLIGTIIRTLGQQLHLQLYQHLRFSLPHRSQLHFFLPQSAPAHP